MKREWLGLALLLALLILGLLATWGMGRRYETMADALEDAGRLAIAGDWEGADRLVRKARSRWEDSWHFTAALTDHEPMEEIDSLLAQLNLYRQQREALAFAALCTQIASRMADIGDAHGLNWWSFL